MFIVSSLPAYPLFYIEKQHGQASGTSAWTCNMDMNTRNMDMHHGHVEWTSSMDKQHGHAGFNFIDFSIDVHYGHVA